ncbi:mitochondrial inner membrane protease ATP23 homolog [Stomoxys calcitrans]|uniref:Mitochondrial inner membrane protease ATP23 n=1 Tax=Stomoxys calcitrans TaxID=35570 RepID=A0A1I8PNY1_STOCA|nr:mitochondrial inner membrane protease ATP23 homolog [Stomoxys calcitrans]
MGWLNKVEAKSQEELPGVDFYASPPASAKSNEQQQQPENKSTAEKSTEKKANSKEWGYDLYPERRGEEFKPKWSRIFLGLEGHENIDKVKCERNVYWCVKNSPLVKLMMGALKSSGCPIDLRRHISCEVCDSSVTGGYDPVLNQIVVCQNMARKEGMVQGVLTHEMIHMFDYCNNDLDFRNIDHLACTEIRAANLAHCSFLSAMMQGDASMFNIKQSHQNCVKSKALASVLAVRNVTRKEAIEAVERVFPKCYNDLEPIGRRIRRNSPDQHRAYMEGPMYGYDVY